MEEIIIQTVNITRQGELKHFEIPISHNAEAITGLWYKIRLLDPAGSGVVISRKGRSTYKPEITIGQLSLSSNQREGVFFFGNLILQNENEGMLDFTSGIFPVQPYSHQNFRKPIEVNINSKTTSVHGFILDNWGVISGKNVRYEVDIYLFLKLNEKIQLT